MFDLQYHSWLSHVVFLPLLFSISVANIILYKQIVLMLVMLGVLSVCLASVKEIQSLPNLSDLISPEETVAC